MAKKTTPANEPTNDTAALPEGVKVPLTQAGQLRLLSELLDLEQRLELANAQKKAWLDAWKAEISDILKRRAQVVAELRGEPGHQIDIFARIDEADGGDS